ncbi:MAG: rod shape-determining protein MreC [Spirochaetaceae bacterium]|jgi:rod shape-determining protein MreC|nr:rod shape-determining protein MreC [Spirochaetaceae bacterium]
MRISKEKKKKGAVSSAYVFVALTLISFSLLLFSTRSFVIDIRDTGLSVFSGVRGAIYSVSSMISHTFLSVKELSSLRKDYAELLQKITRYEQLERTAADIRQENNRLRELLAFSQTMRFTHIPAEISGRDPDNLFSAFVINKGSSSGITVNMPVIAYQNGTQALVGKIIQAGSLESLVMPLYDEKSYISARLAQTRYEGIVQGGLNPEKPLVMRLVPKRAQDEIHTGDVVVSSGVGGVFPPGLNIGRISNIIYREYEPSLELEVKSAVDFSRLEYVFAVDKETIGTGETPFDEVESAQ